MVTVLTNLVDNLSWVIALFSEVADEDLDVLFLLDGVTGVTDFLNQVRVSATDLLSLAPNDLGIDVGFLGTHSELVNEGSINGIVTVDKSSKGSLFVEFGERAVCGHAENDFRDVQMMLVVNIHMMDTSGSPFLS